MLSVMEHKSGPITRRSLLWAGAASLGSLAAPSAGGQRTPRASSFIELLRAPDSVTAYSSFAKTMPAGRTALQPAGVQWRSGDVVVDCTVKENALQLMLAAPSTPIAVVHVRWRSQVQPGLRALGDAWERSYGELGWRDLIPERAMPWYFATYDGAACHGYGVKTGAAALCFWQLDPEGVSLWLNVTNGGEGVELGSRTLTMANVVTRRGNEGENPVDAVAGLCRTMCARPSRPTVPIYGANDWNYSYGQSTAETILRDTEFIVEVSPGGSVRPFSVIDDGWSKGAPAWPDMGKLADQIKQRTARPGIWIRPLQAPHDATPGLLLPGSRFGEKKERAREFAYDPTVPEAMEKIRAKMLQAIGWGYEMVKHDFSTYELLGQWGFEMGPQPTLPGWSLHDKSKTNAEVIAELYAMLRQAAGERVLLEGCNTVGHLGQGVFDLQRTGDDTSGRLWERTRRMGVNTLSFRLPQNGTFYTVDPDLVGITDAVPWELTQQWLDVLARSGAATIVSPGPPARGAQQRAALRDAFKIAAAGGLGVKPVDWMDVSAAEHWRAGGKAEWRYHWSGPEGALAFLSP
jgi:alpha-galactosidase